MQKPESNHDGKGVPLDEFKKRQKYLSWVILVILYQTLSAIPFGFSRIKSIALTKFLNSSISAWYAFNYPFLKE